ncbi:MAG: AI-2E family transporter [Candidatus Promineifilaceae bacterium]
MSTQSPLPVHDSPPWNRNVKLIVSVIFIVITVFAFWKFTTLIRYLVFAGILAYLLDPLISFVEEKTPLKRGHAILLVYFVILGLLVWATVVLGLVGIDELNNLIIIFPSLLDQAADLIADLVSKDYRILGYTLNLNALVDFKSLQGEILSVLENSIQTIVQRTFSVVGGAAQIAVATLSGATAFVLIYMMSMYISAEVPHIGNMVSDVATLPGYREDAERLWREFGRIWKAYLRGQVILGLVMGMVVWIGLLILGVNNAAGLGLLTGILEFLPVIGPIIAGVVAVMVAIFQPENWMGLSFVQYGLAVTAFMVLVQQLENGILVPRIIGDALDLHPLVTLLAVFMGTTLAGILGAILAAPVVATLKLLGTYAWRKLFDQPPFPKDEVDEEEEPLSVGRTLMGWFSRTLSLADDAPVKQNEETASSEEGSVGDGVEAGISAEKKQE